MPNPGVQSQFIARSGSNTFQGEYHADWYNNSLQGSNLPDEYLVPTAFNNQPIREHSNEIDRYYDHDINAGGPIAKDKLWFFGTYRKQFNAVAQPSFTFDKTFDTLLWNAVGKVTYQINQKNKLIGYYQWGQKEQPNRLPDAAYTYASPEQTLAQLSGSWVYKGEWNGTVSDKLYLEARYGDFGYYFPLSTNSPDNFFTQDTGRLVMEGAHQKQQLDRDRKQITFASTYFMDTSKGSHTFKMGAEMFKERSWEGFESRRGGDSNLEHRFNNGAATQVIFGFPTADCAVGTLDAHDVPQGPGGSRCVWPVLDRHLGDWQADRQRRCPLRPLQGLAAGAGPDGGHGSRLGLELPDAGVAGAGEELRTARPLHLELIRATHRRGV